MANTTPEVQRTEVAKQPVTMRISENVTKGQALTCAAVFMASSGGYLSNDDSKSMVEAVRASGLLLDKVKQDSDPVYWNNLDKTFEVRTREYTSYRQSSQLMSIFERDFNTCLNFIYYE